MNPCRRGDDGGEMIFRFPILLLTGKRGPKPYGVMINAMRQGKPDIPAPRIVPRGSQVWCRDNPE
jgi:hypothetical protein